MTHGPHHDIELTAREYIEFREIDKSLRSSDDFAYYFAMSLASSEGFKAIELMIDYEEQSVPITRNPFYLDTTLVHRIADRLFKGPEERSQTIKAERLSRNHVRDTKTQLQNVRLILLQEVIKNDPHLLKHNPENWQ